MGSDSSDDNLAGILDDEYEGGPLSWEQTRAAAETFRSKMYPEYLKLYRRIEQTPSGKVAKEDTVRLWQLHNRLETVKHRIEVACRNSDKARS
jgi:RNA polymerase II elongation factor ELL